MTAHAHNSAEGVSAIECDKQELDPVTLFEGCWRMRAVIRFLKTTRVGKVKEGILTRD